MNLAITGLYPELQNILDDKLLQLINKKNNLNVNFYTKNKYLKYNNINSTVINKFIPKSIFENWLLPQIIKKNNSQILFSTNGILPIVNLIPTVLKLDYYFDKVEEVSIPLPKRLLTSLKKASAIILPTTAHKDSLLNWYAKSLVNKTNKKKNSLFEKLYLDNKEYDNNYPRITDKIHILPPPVEKITEKNNLLLPKDIICLPVDQLTREEIEIAVKATFTLKMSKKIPYVLTALTGNKNSKEIKIFVDQVNKLGIANESAYLLADNIEKFTSILNTAKIVIIPNKYRYAAWYYYQTDNLETMAIVGTNQIGESNGINKNIEYVTDGSLQTWREKLENILEKQNNMGKKQNNISKKQNNWDDYIEDLLNIFKKVLK